MAVVTALTGGAANRKGIRYEDLWVVWRILGMLEGKGSRMRLEPPGEEGDGIEFEFVDENGVVWGEQTKDEKENWTIVRLRDRDVLTAAKTQIGLRRPFRFVTSASVYRLKDLADAARKAPSAEEYRGLLSKQRSGDLSKVAGVWDVSEDEAWEMFRKVYVQQLSSDSLLMDVKVKCELHYVGDPESVIEALGTFCYETLHTHFTAPKVRAYLKQRGFKRQYLRGDPDVSTRLHETVESHERSVKRAQPSVGLVPREDAEAVVGKLQDRHGRRIVVVDGPAGYGKSTVVSSVATALEAQEWHVAVARMDLYREVSTSRQLGVEMDLGDRPFVLLAGATAGGGSALLVVDQLDAISLYSGRMTASFEAVDQVLAELDSYPHIRVLLVVRTVDLEHDWRLQRWLREYQPERHRVRRFALEELMAHMASQGMRFPPSASTLELLRIPLHFALFCRLTDSSRSDPYSTPQDLYETYTREAEGRIEHKIGYSKWGEISETLVMYMSEHEVLTVPASVLDHFSPKEVGALESEALLIRDGTGKVFRFFHESYFDYRFVRWFLASNDSLHDFLANTEQGLFRRSQTRQVLEHYAANDRPLLTREVVRLLASNRIRFHLKDMIVSLLRGIQPCREDWEALDGMAWSGSIIGSKLLTLLNRTPWFDVVDSLGLWEEWLQDPERVEEVFGQLILVARERPARVVQLVRPYIGRSEKWRVRLRRLIEWSLSSELADLAVELIERGEIDDARGPGAVNSDFWSLVYSLNMKDSAAAAKVIGAYLRRGFVRAQQEGFADPFSSGHLSRHSELGSVISDVAAAEPAEFLRRVLPFIVDVSIAHRAQTVNTDRATPPPWRTRWRGSAHGIKAIVFAAATNALETLASQQPEECAATIQDLRDADSEQLRFLACRALTVMNDAYESIGWIVSDSQNLALGWTDSSLWASLELIQKHSSTCSLELFRKLESLILRYAPEWEAQDPDYRGFSKHALLSALDGGQLSEEARCELGELQTRFSPPEPPEPIVARRAVAPISSENAQSMSDDEWILALNTYNKEKPTWEGKELIGGAFELAGVLGQQASQHPERFAKLGLKFDEGIPPVALNAVIDSTSDSIRSGLLTEPVRTRLQHLRHSLSTIGVPGDHRKRPGELSAGTTRCSVRPHPERC